ncbi:MAG: histidinol-phosphate transaminase [Thaumarchaeota archaeon]|nr:histidinol-phosphate transaminase [Nitrososphaerota archaeon]
MKSAYDIAKEHIRHIEPATHGGEIWNQRKPASEIIDFSSNVNPLGISFKVINVIKKNLWRIPFYPDTKYPSLHRAISEYLNVDEENILVGNGSTEIIYLFCEVFLDKGEEVQIPKPTFGEYEIAVRRTGARPKFFELDSVFKVDPDKINYESKIIFICNPNNPTSTFTSRRTIVQVLERAIKQDALVFVDEDFVEFISNPKRNTAVGLVGEYPNLFVLRSFTKFFGLTGLRVGYGIGSKEIVDLLNRVKPPWSVNCLAEVAAVAALHDRGLIKVRHLVEEEREFLFETLGRINGFRPVKPDANFIFVDVSSSNLSASDIKRKLLQRDILIRECSSFGLPNHIRIAIRSRKENKKLVQSLKEIVN